MEAVKPNRHPRNARVVILPESRPAASRIGRVVTVNESGSYGTLSYGVRIEDTRKIVEVPYTRVRAIEDASNPGLEA